MATLIELRRRVSSRLDQALVGNEIPASGVFWTRSEVNDWINEGYAQAFGRMAEVDEDSLLTETSGTYTAGARRVDLLTLLGGLSTSPLKILEVREVTGAAAAAHGRLIPQRRHAEYHPMLPSGEQALAQQAGFASWSWSTYGSAPRYIELFPTPTAALTLRIRYIPGAPNVLSADDNVPYFLPTTHHDLLVDYACIQARLKEENPSARDEQAAFDRKMQNLLDSVDERNVQDGRGVFISDPTFFLP